MDKSTSDFYLELLAKRLQKLNEALDARDRFQAVNLLVLAENDCRNLQRAADQLKDESMQEAAEDIQQNLIIIKKRLNKENHHSHLTAAWKEPIKEKLQRLFGRNPFILKSVIALQSLCFQLRESISEETHAESREHLEEINQANLLLYEQARGVSDKRALKLSQDLQKLVPLARKKIEMRAAYTLVNEMLSLIERAYPKLKHRNNTPIKGEVAQARQVM